MPEEIEKKLAQLQELLEETSAVVNENNRLIRDMRRLSRVAFWFKLILWILVLGLPFLFIGPLFQALFPAITGHGSFLGLPSMEQLMQAFESLKQQSQGML